MHDFTATDHESIDDRDARALTQYLTVLSTDADDLYHVVSESGREYTVDAREGACTCEDFQYRDVECKHLRRVRFATGQRPIPAWINGSAVDDHLGEHVDVDDDQDPDAPGACALVADGGEPESPREDCWCADHDCPCFEHFQPEADR